MTASQTCGILGVILLAPHIKAQHARWLNYGLIVFGAVSFIGERAFAA